MNTTRLGVQLDIANMLREFTGAEWEQTEDGWLDAETNHVFSNDEIVRILASTTRELELLTAAPP